MKVAVVGGAGRLGSWFVHYFHSKGFHTVVSDIKVCEASLLAMDVGIEVVETNIRAVEDVDLVLICVPIIDTPEVIREVAPHMKKGAILCEVSSVKRRAFEALKEAISFGVQPLSFHPMFGPAVDSLEGKTLVVVPVLDEEAEFELVSRLFREAELVVSDHETHDRVMAIVLSLTYFMNLVFAKVLGNEDLKFLKKMAGTSFTLQLALTESIVAENPGLVSTIFSENIFTVPYLNSFMAEAEEVRSLVDKGIEEILKLYDSLKSNLGRDPDFSQADIRRYRAFKALKLRS